MAQFRYTAKSMNGKTRRGTMEVPNETVLQQNLKEQGLFLIQAKNLAEAKDYRKLKNSPAGKLLQGVFHTPGIRYHTGKGTGYYFPAGRADRL